MSKLFKTASFESEIAKSMERFTDLTHSKKLMYFGKIAKIAEHLQDAAEICDNVGMSKEAEILTKMLEKIAADKPIDPVEIQRLLDQEIKDLRQEEKIDKMIGDELKSFEPSGSKPLMVNYKALDQEGEDLPSVFEEDDDLEDLTEDEEKKFTSVARLLNGGHLSKKANALR